MSDRRGRAARLATKPEEQVPPIVRQATGRNPKKLARLRHQALRQQFTAAQWVGAAEQASAVRRRQTGNRRYTPPRAPR